MITSKDMLALEEKAAANGISTLTLMENAGKAFSNLVQEKYTLPGKRLLVVCHHGNNGGDGFVIARFLAEKAEVEVLFLGDETSLKPEAAENFKRLQENAMIQFIALEYVVFDDYDIIIDAILGTGITGELKPIIASTIEAINKSKPVKISVDVPSGLNPDTGEENTACIKPDLTVTFHDLKKGLIKEKTVVVDIGL